MTILIGLDEAGRGPVIGPLVMCGFVVSAEKEQNLVNLGVKDSKMILPNKRELLFNQLADNYDYLLKIVDPKEIDSALEHKDLNLNWLEAHKSAEICNELIEKYNDKEIKIILDCPSANPKAYTEYFKNLLNNKNVQIICEHKADQKYPVVSSASIIAKVTRDRIIKNLNIKHNIDIGSGYPSDPKTKDFLLKNFDKYDFFRKSWSSWKNIEQKLKQKKLGEF
jgi:ribonuclease HII